MYRDKGKLTKTSHVLLYMLTAGDLLYRSKLKSRLSLALYPEERRRLADRRLDIKLHQMYERGWVKIEYKEARQVVKLTRKGELEALFQKAHLPGKARRWDGKWRMVIFDIPENARAVRAQLRKLLKGFGFKALQASVYVYPFDLNRARIEFLRQSGLMRYIRFARVDLFDNDGDLRNLFRDVFHKNDGRQ